MYVKQLTMKGFKSFASATTFRLEPGITCVVGPNGSGKSNVVDALAWVMGEQGAKSLRGGKMEDVIFAGTAGRPPLGRAEVSLTIDNSDGALPIDYTEVTIRRTMFRNGGSDYAINGTACRLLDIQELLSDSGIGREMHVIVGQGQLDTVLRATPEERRGFIEEAAGVLKHRKRKEKALRKLEQMEGNLQRVQDLTGEIRRQLGPLGRQAETARRAATIQADARDARLRLLADDLVQLTSTLEQEVADETALLARRAEVEQSLRTAQQELAALEAGVAALTPQVAAAQEQWFALSSLRDRIAGTGQLAAERARLLADDDAPQGAPAGRDPQTLRAEAAQVRTQEQALAAEVEQVQHRLSETVGRRGELERAHQDEVDRLARLARAAADRREGLARLAGQVAARRSRIEAASAELGRLDEAIEASQARAQQADKEFRALEVSIADHESGEEDLDEAYETAEAARDAAATEVARLQDAARTAEKDRSAAEARVEALQLGLRRRDGGGALLESRMPGVLGPLATLVTVRNGYEAQLAAALGWASDAVAVEGLDAARSALQQLRADDAGQVALVVGGASDPEGTWPGLPDGAVWAIDVVEQVPPGLRPALVRLLRQVALVGAEGTEDQVTAVVAAGATAVTPAGDVHGPGFARGGSASAPSQLEVQAAVDEARAAVAAATHAGEQLGFALQAATARLDDAGQGVDAALDRLNDNDAQLSAVAEQLGALAATARSARAEAERTQRRGGELRTGIEQDRGELAALEQRLADAQATASEDDVEPDTDERDRLAAAATAARGEETELRLTLRTTEERVRGLGGRAAGLERAAAQEELARQQAAQRLARRRREAAVARAVAAGAERAVTVVERLVVAAATRRATAEQERADREAGLVGIRSDVARLAEELRELTDSVHRDEIARAQQRLRIEQLQTRAVEELGIEPDVLVEEYGPHQPVPVLDPPAPAEDDGSAEPRTVPYVRDEQEKRLRKAERGLSALGRVNPLALEEFAALEERHTFLTEQLDDLKKSRRDLLDIVKEVDERVQRVFAEAFEDTAREFVGVFSRLFPGGEGRLLLTDPGDMLTTGIEVEARPPGKKIKRLSLLSGGERSLVAVALLVAIFKARPSPFYIMDEVEAALDDANLGRLIDIFEELRGSSQLIVITHQKRTMEVADALYGVTMRGDGVTTVVSQRVQDVAGIEEAEQGPGADAAQPHPVGAT
ncbi:chromosome segregation protein SMC [Arsenicicoccus sp. oral taxon 190]|uniref:chromosome segregation protein SMC n=1 Tax=Arsenicicoccus sp. oral taxon 190 TaxID=1658671 RepID=UPI00067A1199|nr:chromosome segregation protein SMC [Arsenicicoccus sp. oral taxon 190]AKT52258.1 chromosome segregation protein SMC [Arsenicicoccus sp. oral taxon 190]